MPEIEATIKSQGNTETVTQEVAGNNMSELITSIKAVKESLNTLLSAIVVQEASSSGARKTRPEDAPAEEAEEDGESSDEPEESDKGTTKRQKV